MSVAYQSWDTARSAWQAHLPCAEAEAQGGLCMCRYAYPCPTCGTQIEAIGEDMDGLQELDGRCARCFMAGDEAAEAGPSTGSSDPAGDDSWVDDLFGKGKG